MPAPLAADAARLGSASAELKRSVRGGGVCPGVAMVTDRESVRGEKRSNSRASFY